jgi:hypothetical protein
MKTSINRTGFILLPFISALLLMVDLHAQKTKIPTGLENGNDERAYMVQTLTRIADPVLEALSRRELRKRMPVASVKGREEERKNYTYLEATGRLLAGMAPWLELGPDETAEGQLRKKYITLAIASIKNATDTTSPDFMNFTKGEQPLVDAAFLAHALVRAPKQLYGNLDAQTQKNVLAAFRSTRTILPYYSNWLLFSGMVEAALMKFDRSGDRVRMDYAIKEHLNWYKGDGIYGDGPAFHWDYYNSFVIQPMLLDVLKVLGEAGYPDRRAYDLVLRRAQRYAAVQERLISPEGTYPPIGRSLAYRFGAFQLLSEISLMKVLPKEISPQQVRGALSAVIRRQVETPGTFDGAGWLQIGFNGHQPGVGESYISTGSLYLCSVAFLVLGLPASDDFWSAPDADWTQKKAWKGQEIPIDHAID